MFKLKFNPLTLVFAVVSVILSITGVTLYSKTIELQKNARKDIKYISNEGSENAVRNYKPSPDFHSLDKIRNNKKERVSPNSSNSIAKMAIKKRIEEKKLISARKLISEKKRVSSRKRILAAKKRIAAKKSKAAAKRKAEIRKTILAIKKKKPAKRNLVAKVAKKYIPTKRKTVPTILVEQNVEGKKNRKSEPYTWYENKVLKVEDVTKKADRDSAKINAMDDHKIEKDNISLQNKILNNKAVDVRAAVLKNKKIAKKDYIQGDVDELAEKNFREKISKNLIKKKKEQGITPDDSTALVGDSTNKPITAEESFRLKIKQNLALHRKGDENFISDNATNNNVDNNKVDNEKIYNKILATPNANVLNNPENPNNSNSHTEAVALNESNKKSLPKVRNPDSSIIPDNEVTNFIKQEKKQVEKESEGEATEEDGVKVDSEGEVIDEDEDEDKQKSSKDAEVEESESEESNSEEEEEEEDSSYDIYVESDKFDINNEIALRGDMVDAFEEGLIFASLYLKHFILSKSFDAYEYKGKLYFDFVNVAKMVDIALEYDPNKVELKGFFFKESNSFNINLLKKEILLKGKLLKIGQGSVYLNEGRVYVSLHSFNKWFNLNAKYSSEVYRITINPSTIIPAEQRYLRQEARQKLKERQENEGYTFDFSKHKDIKSHESLLNFPILDITYGGATSGNILEGLAGFFKAFTNFKGNYSLGGVGSIFYLRSNFSLAFTKGKVSGLSLSMKRSFYKGFDLFPFIKMKKKIFHNSLKIKKISTANVSVENVPLSSGSGYGVGVVIDNYPSDNYANEYYPIVHGYTQPLWDVEFRNVDGIIGYTQADSNGFFEFKGFSLQSGKNKLIIKSYGPYGKVKKEVRNYVHSSSMIKQGDLLYKISLVNKSSLSDIIFSEDSISSHFINSDVNSKKRNTSKYNTSLGLYYGLTDKLSLKTKYGRYVVPDGVLNYLSTEVSSLYFDADIKLTAVRDVKNDAFAYRLYYTKTILGKPIYFSYEFYDEEYIGGSKYNVNAAVPLKSKFFTAMSGSKIVPLLQIINYSVNYNRIAYRDNFKEHKVDFNFGKTIGILSFNSTLSYRAKVENVLDFRFFNDVDQGLEYLLTMGMIKRYKKLVMSNRSNLSYKYNHLRKDYIYNWTTLFSIKYKIFHMTPGFTFRFNKDQNLEINNSLYSMFNFNLAKDFKRFRANASIGFSKEGNFSSNFSISSRLGYDKLSRKILLSPKLEDGKAIVHAEIYQDNNFNKTYDVGVDKLIKSMSVKLNNSAIKNLTYLKKNFFYFYLDAFTKTNVSINEIGLDSAVTANNNSYNIVGVPDGVSRLSFPLFPTTELEGVVKVVRKGKVLNLSEVKVYFISDRGEEFSTSIKTDVDGYFYIEKLILGTYTIKLSDKNFKNLKITKVDKIKVSLNKQDDYLELDPLIIDLDHNRFLKYSTYKEIYNVLEIDE